MGPADPHPGAAVSSPPSPQPHLGSGSLPPCNLDPLTLCLLPPVSLDHMSRMSAAGHTVLCERNSPGGLLEHPGSPTFTQVLKQTAFKEKAPLALLAPGMGQRREVKTVSGQPAGDFPFHLCSKGWGPEQGHLASTLMEMDIFHLWVRCLSPDAERCGACICVCEQCVHTWMPAWVSEPVKAGCVTSESVSVSVSVLRCECVWK